MPRNQSPGRPPKPDAKIPVTIGLTPETREFLRAQANQSEFIERLLRTSIEYDAWARRQLLARIKDL